MAPVHLDSGAQCSVLEVLGHALIRSLADGPEPRCAILLIGRERFRALSDNLGYFFGEEPTKQRGQGMTRSKDSRIGQNRTASARLAARQ
jgi:hypothetical protein